MSKHYKVFYRSHSVSFGDHIEGDRALAKHIRNLVKQHNSSGWEITIEEYGDYEYEQKERAELERLKKKFEPAPTQPQSGGRDE